MSKARKQVVDDDRFEPLMDQLESAIHRLKLAAEPDDDESVREGFDALHTRFMSLLSRLQVLSEVLDCDKVPNELAPAAYVLQDTAKDADQLWEDAEAWYIHHEHTPKEVQS